MAPLSTPNALSLEDIWHDQSYIGTLAINSAVVFGIVLWDHIQLLPEERSLYEVRRRREWRSPAPWAFILLRYAALVSTVCSLAYTAFELPNCQTAASIGQASSVVVVASSGIIFSSRVASLWDKQRFPMVITVLSCIVTVCAWMSVGVQFKVTMGQKLPFGSNCQFSELATWTPISYAATAIFNCIVLAVVVTRVLTKATIVSTNSGLTLINRACILYLMCGTISSLVVLSMYAINLKDELFRRSAMPYSILFMTTMGSRIFLNLQLHNHTLTRVAESNHFTSPTWSPDKAIITQTTSSRTYPNEPEYDPAQTVLSSPRSEVRSLDTYTTHTTRMTTLTVPETPATVTSFSGSTTYSGSSYGRVMTRPTPGSPKNHHSRGGGSLRSVSSGSTRLTDMTPRSPRSGRAGSVRSYSTNSTSTRQTAPKSPRRVRVPSYSEAPRTVLPAENLKSTWHGV